MPSFELVQHGPDIDGPENGQPSQVAIMMWGDWIFWVDSGGRFRRGALNAQGKLYAIGPDMDGPENNGQPSQVAITMWGDWIYWVNSGGRFRRGGLNDEHKLYPIGPDVDGPENNGQPSQVAIGIWGDWIFWVDSHHRFRRGVIQGNGHLGSVEDIALPAGTEIKAFMIWADWIYWVDSHGRFRRGTLVNMGVEPPDEEEQDEYCCQMQNEDGDTLSKTITANSFASASQKCMQLAQYYGYPAGTVSSGSCGGDIDSLSQHALHAAMPDSNLVARKTKRRQ